jgi:hypothetical protein
MSLPDTSFRVLKSRRRRTFKVSTDSTQTGQELLERDAAVRHTGCIAQAPGGREKCADGIFLIHLRLYTSLLQDKRPQNQSKSLLLSAGKNHPTSSQQDSLIKEPLLLSGNEEAL